MRRWLNLFSYFAIAIAASDPLCAFEAHDRWFNTATNGSTGPQGTPITLRWSLVDDGTMIPDGSALVSSNLIDMLDATFGGAPGGPNYAMRPWFSIFTDSYNRLSDLAGLDFVYESVDDGANFATGNSGAIGVRGDLRLGGRTYGANSNTLAANFFPDYGEMMINTDKGSTFDNQSSSNYTTFRNTLMHETMHGLGVSHVDSSSPGFLMEPQITASFDGPQLDDILAIQRLYGDVLEKNGGNDSSNFATPLGLVNESQGAITGQNGNSLAVAAGEMDFVSIDDDSDVDFFSFTLTESYNISLELRPQGASYQTGPQNGTVETLNTRALSDLTLTLFNTNGTSILGTANASGLGGTETLATSLSSGTYFARVTGAQDNIQLYQLAVTVPGNPENLTWTGQVNNTWDVLTTANFNDGGGADEFAHLDTVTFNDSAQQTSVNIATNVNPTAVVIDAAGNYTFSGSGAITGGSLTINGSGTVEFSNSGNTYSGPTQVNAGTLIFSGDTSQMVSAITVAGGATLVMDSNVAGANSSSFEIEPGGTLQVGRLTPNSNVDVFPNSPASLVNNGVIRIVDFESVTNISGSGDVIAVEELALLGNNSYSGQTIVEAGGSIQPTDNSAFGTTAGNTVVQSGGFIVARVDNFGPASLVVSESFEFAGNGDGGGALQITAGTTATFHGSWTIADGGATISVSGDSSAVQFGALNAVAGRPTFDVADGDTLEFGGASTFAAGLVKTSPGRTMLAGTVDLNGPVDVQGGTLALSGNGSATSAVRIASGATLELTGSAVWQTASSITGNGMIDGNLVMPGAIAPGDSGAGELLVTGNLSLFDQSDLFIEIGGVLPGQYDRLNVDGIVTLDGTLSVELIDIGGGVYQPQDGDSFGFLAADLGTSGEFDALILPALSGGLGWQINPGAITTFLEVVQLANADFNDDGFVDGADFLALQRNAPTLIPDWEDQFGTINAVAGPANGADFLRLQRENPALIGQWQTNFAAGRGSGNVAPVPEPAAWLLLLASAVWHTAATRRRRRPATT